ncbi:hypothetical protein LHYA1_G005264 [Lachnellula hyalina]|uniref:Uncharacterized protein n=1 Tax=Lachnellula hyalina TaxID=1316788 RepID=A0A8H8R333_9HELO|nr:uncharacterized protein LHYA1_G005264 [Lachnellula hyalina]TVY27151.1 hypothetical protein LHYA1_G005264 [Lachnellula hyalina]
MASLSSDSSSQSKWSSQTENSSTLQQPLTPSSPAPGSHTVPPAMKPPHGTSIEGDQVRSTGEEDLLVNSSLMFFSTRPDASSLHLLANTPKLEPQALEILLRNWKPGGEHLRYLHHFVQSSTCCTAIPVMNWTRWWGTDETLFDLVDNFVGEEERTLVTRTLLSADMKFQLDFTRLRASWADSWRSACRQHRWADAKEHLLGFRVNTLLKDSALSVVAEHFLQRRHRALETWRIGSSRSLEGTPQVFPVEGRDEFLGILRDCREMRLDVAKSCTGGENG